MDLRQHQGCFAVAGRSRLASSTRVASLRQSSLLGEKFVELAAPVRSLPRHVARAT
jgi:ABC-type transporter Mla subunit MlaD